MVKPTGVNLLAAVVGSFAVARSGEGLDLGGLAWLGALVAGLVLVPLVDRDYLHGPSSRSRPY